MLDIVENAGKKTCAVYVVSHERSGTHFLINTMNANFPLRVGQGVGKGSGRGWNNVGEWFGPYGADESKYRHIEYYNETLWNVGKKRNAIIKSHTDYELFRKSFRKVPAVYIYRNPLDVMASWFHYLNNSEFYRHNPSVEDMRCTNFSEFIRRPLSPFLQYSFSEGNKSSNVVDRWATHVKGWIDSGDACCVQYEELKGDPSKIAQRISDYLGMDAKSDITTISIGKSKSVLPRKGVVGDGLKLCSGDDLEFIKATVKSSGVDWDMVTQIR